MSSSGLNSGLFQQFYQYAELTDKAIIEATDSTSTSRRNREKLGNMLVELPRLRKTDISARLIWNLLTEEMNLREDEINSIGHSLLEQSADETAIDMLEKLAYVLAEEQEVIKSRQRSVIR
ncbi:MAG: hypothetical protein E6H09_21910 [Bacteroidetes bacterium]|nr:MAG: hypothetical protein E6H09_21910 [Bacteroidota bacterium]